MSSLVELKNACIDKALEIVQSMTPGSDDADELETTARALAHTVGAAVTADAQANADSWSGSQTAGKEQQHG